LKGWRYDLFGQYAEQLKRGELALRPATAKSYGRRCLVRNSWRFGLTRLASARVSATPGEDALGQSPFTALRAARNSATNSTPATTKILIFLIHQGVRRISG
jgi:hypothetical protein